MEEDRAVADLGPEVVPDDHDNVVKTPKRRFIGRKTADARATAERADGSIEDSGAIQGRYLSSSQPFLHLA